MAHNQKLASALTRLHFAFQSLKQRIYIQGANHMNSIRTQQLGNYHCSQKLIYLV